MFFNNCLPLPRQRSEHAEWPFEPQLVKRCVASAAQCEMIMRRTSGGNVENSWRVTSGAVEPVDKLSDSGTVGVRSIGVGIRMSWGSAPRKASCC